MGLMDCVNAAFCLAIALVVVGGGHLGCDLKVLHELLPEVQGELAVSVRDNREGVFMNCEYLLQKDLGSLFCINILGDREQVCIATEAIKNNKNKITFLVA
jgi:hypothetical protein